MQDISGKTLIMPDLELAKVHIAPSCSENFKSVVRVSTIGIQNPKFCIVVSCVNISVGVSIEQQYLYLPHPVVQKQWWASCSTEAVVGIVSLKWNTVYIYKEKTELKETAL